jgi:hypothetical protein
MKFDRNEIEYDSIRNFLRHYSADNASFNSFLRSTDTFNINEKLCLDILYRNYFFFSLLFHSIKDKEFN